MGPISKHLVILGLATSLGALGLRLAGRLAEQMWRSPRAAVGAVAAAAAAAT